MSANQLDTSNKLYCEQALSNALRNLGRRNLEEQYRILEQAKLHRLDPQPQSQPNPHRTKRPNSSLSPDMTASVRHTMHGTERQAQPAIPVASLEIQRRKTTDDMRNELMLGVRKSLSRADPNQQLQVAMAISAATKKYDEMMMTTHGEQEQPPSSSASSLFSPPDSSSRHLSVAAERHAAYEDLSPTSHALGLIDEEKQYQNGGDGLLLSSPESEKIARKVIETSRAEAAIMALNAFSTSCDPDELEEAMKQSLSLSIAKSPSVDEVEQAIKLSLQLEEKRKQQIQRMQQQMQYLSSLSPSLPPPADPYSLSATAVTGAMKTPSEERAEIEEAVQQSLSRSLACTSVPSVDPEDMAFAVQASLAEVAEAAGIEQSLSYSTEEQQMLVRDIKTAVNRSLKDTTFEKFDLHCDTNAAAGGSRESVGSSSSINSRSSGATTAGTSSTALDRGILLQRSSSSISSASSASIYSGSGGSPTTSCGSSPSHAVQQHSTNHASAAGSAGVNNRSLRSIGTSPHTPVLRVGAQQQKQQQLQQQQQQYQHPPPQGVPIVQPVRLTGAPVASSHDRRVGSILNQHAAGQQQHALPPPHQSPFHDDSVLDSHPFQHQQHYKHRHLPQPQLQPQSHQSQAQVQAQGRRRRVRIGGEEIIGLEAELVEYQNSLRQQANHQYQQHQQQYQQNMHGSFCEDRR